MSELLIASEADEARHARAAETRTARLVRRYLHGARRGALTVSLPSGERIAIRGMLPGPEVDVALHWRGLWRIAARGDIGFAEGFRDRDWSTSDVLGVLRWASANESALADASRGWAPVLLMQRVQHHFRRNTRPNSRRNVQAHYDLGNAFYASWLDEGMNYSSGYYTEPGLSLEAAQAAKLDRITALLNLRGGERVLDIGCGWGPLTERLAAHNTHVTALTLSPHQQAYAEARLRKCGFGDRTDIRLQDYRDVRGTFERIASVEMLEAVGEAYWHVYFDALTARLARGGMAVLQVITIDAERFAGYRRRPDFIQTHIFPGGMLPTVAIIEKQAGRAGLKLLQRESFGASYALTLAAWRTRFNASWPRIAELGFDAPFKRLWNYYLAYCQAGFESEALSVGLYAFGHKTPP
jgi:cyclopropane-fatty-acyl-phospholipid synthase